MLNALADRRRLVGLTQGELAELAGCSRAMVLLLEGGYEPQRSVVRDRIERALQGLEGVNDRPAVWGPVETVGTGDGHGTGI